MINNKNRNFKNYKTKLIKITLNLFIRTKIKCKINNNKILILNKSIF